MLKDALFIKIIKKEKTVFYIFVYRHVRRGGSVVGLMLCIRRAAGSNPTLSVI